MMKLPGSWRSLESQTTSLKTRNKGKTPDQASDQMIT